MGIFFPAVLVSAVVLDLILGDPHWLPHPVRLMGRAASSLEAFLRKPGDVPSKERANGVFMALTVVLSVLIASTVVLFAAYLYSAVLFYALSVYLAWTTLSIKSLESEAASVAAAYESGGITEARKRLARIVGRDTDTLASQGVFRAACETVAENTNDGVVAPLFYLAIGGPALALTYKAVNTLDSMVGYRNERYRDFGWFSARMDDAANYIPARLTGALMVCASFILGYNWRGALRVIVRDRKNHPSPNSGVSEAAVAGALGVRFGGQMSYGGVPGEKPFIGDDTNEITAATLRSTIKIMRSTALLMTAAAFLVRAAAVLLLL